MSERMKTRLSKAIYMLLFVLHHPKTYQPAREKNKQQKITKSMQIF
jgi:hypothetical protein